LDVLQRQLTEALGIALSCICAFQDFTGDDLGAGIGSVYQPKFTQCGLVGRRQDVNGTVVERGTLQQAMDWQPVPPEEGCIIARGHQVDAGSRYVLHKKEANAGGAGSRNEAVPRPELGRPATYNYCRTDRRFSSAGNWRSFAVAAYAIKISPVLKWAFVLIAMLPVSLYNRSVLSTDGAALSSALVITALCLGGVRKFPVARVWERSVWLGAQRQGLACPRHGVGLVATMLWIVVLGWLVLHVAQLVL